MSDRDRVQKLEDQLYNLQQVVIGLISRGGMTFGLHKGIDCERNKSIPLDTFFMSGDLGNDPEEKLHLKIETATAQDTTGQKGVIGLSIGVNGRALSQVDSLPAGQVTEV